MSRARKNPIAERPLNFEEIEPEDNRPAVGEWYEIDWTENISADYYDPISTALAKVKTNQKPDLYHIEYAFRNASNADGPVLNSTSPNKYGYRTVTRRMLVCVTDVGSNYATVQSLSGSSQRVHLDNFHMLCIRVTDPAARISQGISYWQSVMHNATSRIQQVMRDIGLEGRELAPSTQTLAVSIGNQSGDAYKKKLAAAREELPVHYKVLEEAGRHLGKWMAASTLPLQGQSKALLLQMAAIDRRVLAVDLYAGLSEEAICVREGEPAAYAEPVFVMQRMAFMDEECIAFYKAGGMEFADIRAFDRWVAGDEHFVRLFPHPRTVVAFRVRRHNKEREGYNLWEHIRLEIDDKLTYLYVRNGEQLHRIGTAMEFKEALFPDREHSRFTLGDKLWASKDGVIITDAERKQMIRDEKRIRKTAKNAKNADTATSHKLEWEARALVDRLRDFTVFNDSNVLFDDLQRAVAKQVEEHNRLAVLLQGLFDRSAILHPHPPVQLWNADSFARSVRLVYDLDRALVSGPAPDFEAYRVKLNESITRASYVIGAYDAWAAHETEKWEERYGYRSRDWEKWRPSSDNPGPPKIALVHEHKPRICHSVFCWTRQRLHKPKRRRLSSSDEINCWITVPDNELFNVSAYKPGDFRQFYADPRTRAEYLKWAKYLLAAEDWYAKRGKPQTRD